MNRPKLFGEEIPFAFPKGKYGKDKDQYRLGMTYALAWFENSVHAVNMNNSYKQNDIKLYGKVAWSTTYGIIEAYVRTYKLSRQLDEYRKIIGIEHKGLDTEYWYNQGLEIAKNHNDNSILVFNGLLKQWMGTIQQHSPVVIYYDDKVHNPVIEISTTNNQ